MIYFGVSACRHHLADSQSLHVGDGVLAWALALVDVGGLHREPEPDLEE